MSKLQKIGAIASIGLVVGNIVGTGIFVTPAMVAKFTTALWPTFLLWATGGLMCAIGGEIYGRLGEKFPMGGGEYIYLERGLGIRMAVVYGWISFLIISPSMIASYCVFFGEQAKTYFPHLSVWQIQAAAIAFMTVITLINHFGILTTGNFEKIIVGLQILLILALFVTLTFFRGTYVAHATSSFSDSSISTAAIAIVGILWSYEGFNCLSFIAGEIKESAKKLTSYLMIGCAIVMVLYFILNFLSLAYIRANELSGIPNIAVPLAQKAFGNFSGPMTMILMLVAVFMTSVPSVMIGPRVTQRMASESWLPKNLGKLHPKYTSPYVAIWAQFLISIIFVFIGNFECLISCFIVVNWCFYILVAVCFLKLCKAGSKKMRGLDILKTIVFIALALSVIVIQSFRDPKLSLMGALFLVGGLIVAKLMIKKRESVLS